MMARYRYLLCVLLVLGTAAGEELIGGEPVSQLTDAFAPGTIYSEEVEGLQDEQQKGLFPADEEASTKKESDEEAGGYTEEEATLLAATAGIGGITVGVGGVAVGGGLFALVNSWRKKKKLRLLEKEKVERAAEQVKSGRGGGIPVLDAPLADKAGGQRASIEHLDLAGVAPRTSRSSKPGETSRATDALDLQPSPRKSPRALGSQDDSALPPSSYRLNRSGSSLQSLDDNAKNKPSRVPLLQVAGLKPSAPPLSPVKPSAPPLSPVAPPSYRADQGSSNTPGQPMSRTQFATQASPASGAQLPPPPPANQGQSSQPGSLPQPLQSGRLQSGRRSGGDPGPATRPKSLMERARRAFSKSQKSAR